MTITSKRMKRSGAGDRRVAEKKAVSQVDLRPLNVYRSAILHEPIEQIVEVSNDGVPIYTSKSYACVGESACVVQLPFGTLKGSISADDFYIAGLCNHGQTVFYHRCTECTLQEQTTFFNPPLQYVPSHTAVISSGGQRCVLVMGNRTLQTILVPAHQSILPRCQCIASVDGNLKTYVLDASGLFYHVTYDTGDWYQVLADGEITQRSALGLHETLLAADARRALFLMRKGDSLVLAQGAIEFSLPVYVAETDRVKVVWGESDMLYIQIGTADLVPAMTAVQISTGAVLDTKFPTGVAPGTLREFQTLYANGGTLVHNNGVYRLDSAVSDALRV